MFVTKATGRKKVEVLMIPACPLLNNSKDGGQEWQLHQSCRIFIFGSKKKIRDSKENPKTNG